jgi:3-oxoacyl-[acyl-carrier protein] reductase
MAHRVPEVTEGQFIPTVDATSVPSALITGGSRGIGFGIAKLLVARGWRLTLAARHLNQLEEAAQKLTTAAGRVQVVAGDIADDATINDVVGRHQAAFGNLSALVLAAGVGSAGEIAGYPLSRYDKQFAVNARSPFALVSRTLPLLRRSAAAVPSGRSHVVAITSIDGIYAEQGLAAYGASKAALLSLIRSVNTEENARGVLATAISPAFVATELSAWTIDTIPFESMISVADVVNVVDLLMNLSPNTCIPHVVMNRVGAGLYRA